MANISTSKISFYHYNADECIYSEEFSLAQCAAQDHTKYVNWLNIIGNNDQNILQQAAEVFKIHPLVIEDIANGNQRAKLEAYDDMLFVVLRMFAIIDGEVQDQQVGFVLRDNLILTFRETDYGVFGKTIGDKIIFGSGNIRKRGEDYLFYMLLDVIIDHYYFVLQFINDKIENLEVEVLRQPDNRHLVILQRLKSDVLYIRKHIIPVRDLINLLSHNDVEYFEEENKYYLRDLQDHMTRNVEEIDFHRDQLSGLMDLYYSLQNQKMNNVMKTLTVISTIFMPLTFIVGVYGMNFKNMPELESHYGYYVVWGVMLLLIIGMLFYFKKLHWFDVRELRSEKNKES